MKFARDFQTSLEKGEYPQEWIDTAIAYRKLKKCIKKVRQELQELGLDRAALEALLQSAQNAGGKQTQAGQKSDSHTRPLQYTFPDGFSSSFVPKLTIAIDPRDGSPMDAWLSADTRAHLRSLATDQQACRRRSVISLDSLDHSTAVSADETAVSSGIRGPATEPASAEQDLDLTEEVETIEVPLTSDLEFFQTLSRQLSKLEQLQKTEQDDLRSQIVDLGHNLQNLKSAPSKKSKASIEVWREIFKQYTESQVFFSSNEHDAGARDAAHAQKQLQQFNRAIMAEHKARSTTDKLVGTAVEQFMHINLNLLRLVKFQEINRTALSKILKKFDKQTALQTHVNKSPWLTDAPFVAQDLAKATCYTISTQLLEVIPQLDDYLCPVCFTISFRPIRLRCQHVFCIRCLIIMQRAKQDHCPLCRGNVVMEADSDNLDEKLTKFLRANFPQEVKAKQKANELAAGIDEFGEQFRGTHRCSIM